MADQNWTENQKKAINAKGGSILVSAAAGSGKTAVLVQRIIEKLTDPTCPCDADKLLIITFTNAAAAEIKQRLNDEITSLISKNPRDKNLVRQQILLSYANIGTVHSFCSKIIRENFHYLDIPPNFRVADSNELLSLKERAMQDAIENLYQENNKEFIALVENVSAVKDDSKLTEIIEKIYNFSQSLPFPEDWFAENFNKYKNALPISKDSWIETILIYAKQASDYCIDILNGIISDLNNDLTLCKAYMKPLLADLDNFSKLKYMIKKKIGMRLFHAYKRFRLRG
ncbi:MAG: UvrD-helicase domain-containing protein [Lactobacillales bacterium]|jgi:ATP-dependent helicase/nuclease subunit A|nr:UvrD-helicase domain-containing protein [Lactobacillales bacterium]MDR1253515.1 UvrD-helicase domain-containing protein [Oscillospiraceae bacterium]